MSDGGDELDAMLGRAKAERGASRDVFVEVIVRGPDGFYKRAVCAAARTERWADKNVIKWVAQDCVRVASDEAMEAVTEHWKAG